MLKKYTWGEVRQEVAKLQPEFAKQIDALSPGDDHVIYKARYPFGADILQNGVLYVPIENEQEQTVPITDNRVDKEVREALFASRVMPMAIPLNRSVELYMSVNDRNLPFSIAKPGKIMGLWGIQKDEISEFTKTVWNITAGGRAIHVLPKISDIKKFRRLKERFALPMEAPQSLDDHWQIIKGIANSKEFEEEWYVDMLFFSEKWLDHLDDPAWESFDLHLFKLLWASNAHLRRQTVFYIEFSEACLQANSKPDPYIIETTRHLFNTAFGAVPSYTFAHNNQLLPLVGIQRALDEVYQLSYAPSIVTLDYLNPQIKSQALYYSLQVPTLSSILPKIRKSSTKLLDLYNIQGLLKRSLKLMVENTPEGQNALISKVGDTVRFDCFHAEPGDYRDIKYVEDIAEEDKVIEQEEKHYGKNFCSTSAFLRGCIRVKTQ